MESEMTAIRESEMITENADAFPGIVDVEKKLYSMFAEEDGLVGDMCLKLLKSGGKRLRPMIVIMSGLCFSHLSSNIIDTAVAAELIHMASLVHDDVIDKSDSRRGNRTVNSIYGNHPAVLAGDYLFAKAFSLMSSKRLLESMEYLVEAIVQMCDGEINQMDDFFNTKITVDDYFKRIAKKTSILISSCCRAGAATAGAAGKYIEIMNEYGMNIGYAFQIVDDILDFTGDSKITGKPTGLDLLNGNITLPIILLLNNAYHGKNVREMIGAGRITPDIYLYIRELLTKTGTIEESYDIAQKCIDHAKECIHNIPNSSYKSSFNDIADRVLGRRC